MSEKYLESEKHGKTLIEKQSAINITFQNSQINRANYKNGPICEGNFCQKGWANKYKGQESSSSLYFICSSALDEDMWLKY